MSTQSYIKDLTTFPSGGSKTFSLISGSGTVLFTYNSPLSYVGLTNIEPIGDGTGIAELWRYRTQFEINQNTTGAYPTSPGVFPGRIINTTDAAGNITSTSTDIQSAARYYNQFIANHTLTFAPPYSFVDFRGAEAFYVTLVSGKAETAADRTRNYPSLKSALVALLKFNTAPLRRWFKCDPSSKWKNVLSIGLSVITVALVIGTMLINPAALSVLQGAGVILTDLAFAASTAAVWGMKRDPNRCWLYTYKRDAEFTVKVNGGYGPTGKFRLTLIESSKGVISQSLVNEGVDVTFSNLRGSNSGEDGVDVGDYILNVADVITDKQFNLKIFVPYAPYGDMYVIRSATLKAAYKVGSSPFIPSVGNAFWMPATPATPTGPPAGELQDSFINSDSSTCNSTTNTLACIIDSSDIDVRWKFSFRKPPTTAWTDVGTWATEPAAGLTFGKMVTASFTTNSDAFSGLWRIELDSTRVTTPIIISNIVDDRVFPSITKPATFEIYNPLTDFFLANPEATIAKKTVITLATVPVTSRTEYEIEVKFGTNCCKNTSITAHMFKADLNDTFWDQTIDTAFAANSSNLPTTVFAASTALNMTVGGDISKSFVVPGTDTTNTFKFVIPSGITGDVYTFALRANVTVSPFNTEFRPEAYFESYTEIDPTTGLPVIDPATGLPVIATSKAYAVLTLT